MDMPSSPVASFGDNVRVRSTPLTERLGLANLIGNVHGETTPSVTGVEVIGESEVNRALNIFFADQKKGFWFATELLEFIDHAPGAEIRLKGVPKKWIRSTTGEWKEIDTSGEQPARSPWWKSGAKISK